MARRAGRDGRAWTNPTGATGVLTTEPAAPCGGSVESGVESGGIRVASDGAPVGETVDGVSPVDAPPGAGAAGSTGAVGAAATGPPTTSRNRSWAVCPSDRAWSPSSPGTVMVMFVPSRTTSAPLTPSPFTRCSMIVCACRSCSRGGSPPDSVRAVSVTRVPPCRSMPSLGVGLSPVKNTSA